MKIEGFGDRSAADHLVGKPDLGQHMHAVRRDLQAAADARWSRARLRIIAASMPAFFSKIAVTGPAMPAPMIRALRGRLRHALLHASVKW